MKKFIRKNKNNYRNQNKKTKSKLSFLRKAFICLFVFFIVLSLSRLNIDYSNRFIEGIEYILTYEYDVHDLADNSYILNFVMEKLYFTDNEKRKPNEVYKVSNSRVIADLPAKGNIKYGYNDGILIGADYNSPVKAVMDGIVKDIEQTEEHGNIIVLEHENNIETYYGNCKVVLVSLGNKVTKNQMIARTGKEYIEDGYNLYFEVRSNDEPIDVFVE